MTNDSIQVLWNEKQYRWEIYKNGYRYGHIGGDISIDAIKRRALEQFNIKAIFPSNAPNITAIEFIKDNKVP